MVADKMKAILNHFYGLELIIFGLSFMFCLLPKAIKTVDRLAKVFPILTLASAGFLLAVLLLDFIPHMFPHDHGTLHTSGSHTHDEYHGCCNHTHAHDSHDQSYRNTLTGMICAGVALLSLIGIDQCVIKHEHCVDTEEHIHEDHCVDEDRKEDHCVDEDRKEEHCVDEDLKEEHFVDEDRKEEHCVDEDRKEVTINLVNNTKVVKHSHIKPDIGCCNTKMLQNTESKTKALIYIFSISIHSFFEGLGMKKRDFGTYEFGIILHKVLESFAIGMTLFNSAFSFSVCLLMNVFYSILTPLGMFISKYFTGDFYKIKGIPISFFFNGLALGSLMFIVFLEMIPGAFHKAGNKTWKMLGLFLGFILSSILIVMTPHSH